MERKCDGTLVANEGGLGLRCVVLVKVEFKVLVSMSGKRVKGQMAGYPVSKFAL